MQQYSPRSRAWITRRFATPFALLCAAILTACGGGGGSASSDPAPAAPPPAASASIGSVDGTITGFGSVIIDGVRYDDSKAKVLFNHLPESLTQGSLGDLRTGMRVTAELKEGVLQSVTVNFALVGLISAVDSTAGTITVFGQNIKVVSGEVLPTVFEGFDQLSQLAAGDLVKVSGNVASDGAISATRIERKAKDGAEAYRLSGLVQAMDSSAKTFTLAGNSSVTVDYSAAKVLPAGAVLENSKLVSVVATGAPSASGGKTVLKAAAIEVKARKLPDAPAVSVGGLISDFTSMSAMRIGDVLVDASAAKLAEGTSVADVANGAQALAQGAITEGKMKADRLKVFKNETAVKAMLVGQITDYIGLNNFTLRGTVVDASQAQFSKGSASDLAVGSWVKLTGTLTSSGVTAKEIELIPPPESKPATLAGTLSGLDATKKQFTLAGTTVQWTDSTKLTPEGKSLSALANGITVQVTGSYSSSTQVFTATGINVVYTTSGSRTVGFSGVAYEVNAQGFKVGSNLVVLTPDTKILPSGRNVADITNGVRISVKALLTLKDGKPTLTAIQIEVQKPEKDSAGQEMVYLAGLITDYVSSSDFKVNGQAVDASDAKVEFIDGSAAKLANGLKVEIKGVLKDGVLKASRVHFMPG